MKLQLRSVKSILKGLAQLGGNQMMNGGGGVGSSGNTTNNNNNNSMGAELLLALAGKDNEIA